MTDLKRTIELEEIFVGDDDEQITVRVMTGAVTIRLEVNDSLDGITLAPADFARVVAATETYARMVLAAGNTRLAKTGRRAYSGPAEATA
jgi:hypothetical protein